MKLLRLRGRKVCDHLLRHGSVWKGRHMLIRWSGDHPRHPSVRRDTQAIYVGTIASTKLDKSAVRRNRMRRRCREALRIVLKKLSEAPTTQLLIAPRSSSLDAPFLALEGDIASFFSFRIHGRR